MGIKDVREGRRVGMKEVMEGEDGGSEARGHPRTTGVVS